MNVLSKMPKEWCPANFDMGHTFFSKEILSHYERKINIPFSFITFSPVSTVLLLFCILYSNDFSLAIYGGSQARPPHRGQPGSAMNFVGIRFQRSSLNVVENWRGINAWQSKQRNFAKPMILIISGCIPLHSYTEEWTPLWFSSLLLLNKKYPKLPCCDSNWGAPTSTLWQAGALTTYLGGNGQAPHTRIQTHHLK